MLLMLGRYKKQNHDVEEPEWPHYEFGGIVLDSVTKNPLDKCIVNLTIGELIYDYDEQFDTLEYITDFTGTFFFTGLPATNHYRVSVSKPGYYHFTENIQWVLKDSINHRITLLGPADEPRIAFCPYTGIGITIWAGTDTNRIQNICNQGQGLSLVWELSWKKTVDWISASPMSGSTAPGRCHQVIIHFDATNIFERKTL